MPKKPSFKEQVTFFDKRTEVAFKNLDELVILVDRIGLEKLGNEISQQVGVIRYELNKLKVLAGCD